MDKYLKEALEEYETNIESGTSFYMDASILMDIEEYYEKKEMEYDAERVIRFAEKLHPDNEEVNLVKAYRLKSKGHWEAALNIINNITNHASRDIQLFLIEYEVASALLDSAEKRIENNIPKESESEKNDWYLDASEIFLDYGYYHRAIKYLNKLPENYKLRQRADELKADVYYQLGMYPQSTETFNNLIDADPYDAISWTQLADIQQKRGNLADCIVSCDYALAIDPMNQRAMSLKLFATYGLNKYKEGLILFKAFEHKLPDDYTIRMYTGEQMFAHNDIKNALQPLQEALRLCPLDSADRPRIVNDLTYALVELNQTTLAEEIITSLCTIGTSLADVYFQFATILFDSARNDQACKELEKILNVEKDNGKNYIKIMQMLFQNKCFKDAETLWKRIAIFQPSSTEYYPVFAYSAYAMYQIKSAELYIHCLQNGFIHCPDTLIQIVGPIYESNDLKVILQKGQDDALQWRNN